MKPKKITWETPKETKWGKEYPVNDSIYGFVEGFFQNPKSKYELSWFEIRKKGKRSIKYVLHSHPIWNEYFVRANNSKVIKDFETIEEAKKKAQEIFDEFVQSLIAPPEEEFGLPYILGCNDYHEIEHHADKITKTVGKKVKFHELSDTEKESLPKLKDFYAGVIYIGKRPNKKDWKSLKII